MRDHVDNSLPSSAALLLLNILFVYLREHGVGERVDVPCGGDDVAGEEGGRHVVHVRLDEAAERVADAVHVVAHPENKQVNVNERV